MKDYYQYKKTGYKLPKPIYAKTVKTIQSYDFYQGVVNSVDNKSESKVTVDDANNKAVAEYYINIIDKALQEYVVKELREAIFSHVAREADYIYLSEIYNVSVSVMKRWTQRFIYGVATELGENYGW